MSRSVTVVIKWSLLCAAGAALGACRHIPPPVPDPTLLGCYSLQTNLPSSYSDSLGYHLPALIQLATTEYNQWTVYPTDSDWHPSWSVYDGLPSTHIRRRREEPSGSPVLSPERFEASARIPNDSVDIHFPSAVGQLVLRLGRDGEELRGRAEWSAAGHDYHLNEGVVVRAQRTACDGVPAALVRTRD